VTTADEAVSRRLAFELCCCWEPGRSHRELRALKVVDLARVKINHSQPWTPATLRLDGLNGSLSSPSAVWMWVVATEVMLLAVGVWLSKLVLECWGPGRLRGVASRGAAERLLGVTRLRKVRTVVRPDLYGKNQDK
jgi:hypothetical protein